MATPGQPPSNTDKLVQLGTHQAKNLELLKNDGEWMRGRVQSIDELLTKAVDETAEQLRAINRKLWHVVFWIYFWSILAIVGAVLSLPDWAR